jgi:hypothetical protein
MKGHTTAPAVTGLGVNLDFVDEHEMTGHNESTYRAGTPFLLYGEKAARKPAQVAFPSLVRYGGLNPCENLRAG